MSRGIIQYNIQKQSRIDLEKLRLLFETLENNNIDQNNFKDYITPDSIGAANSSHNHNLKDISGKGTLIDGDFINLFRQLINGNADPGEFINAIKTNNVTTGLTQYGAGIAFGLQDTHSYLSVAYNTPVAIIGGGNEGKINWYKELAFKDSTVANSNTVGGHGQTHFVRSKDYGISNDELNDPNYMYPYIVDRSGLSFMPSTEWWHIIFSPHSNTNGHGGQLALSFYGRTQIYYRSSSGTKWGVIGQ